MPQPLPADGHPGGKRFDKAAHTAPLFQGTPVNTTTEPAVHSLSLTRRRQARALVLLGPVLVVVIIIAIGVGAVDIRPAQVISILLSYLGIEPFTEFTAIQERVLFAIRLPRVVLGALVGAALAVSGAAMQGLFRNPLADPGLLGISSGASLAATASIVVGFSALGIYSLPLAAFLGAVATTAIIYLIAQERGRVNVATMLLAGIAINAICGAMTGLFVYIASDAELRTITFWQLGSLSSAGWSSVLTAGPFLLGTIMLMPFLANALNAMLLGESNARHLGVPVDTVKWFIISLVALGVGAGVAVSGMIGFVGLVVPHLIRLWLGPNHRTLLPASALLGAILLILADLLARTVVVPAELPIGIVTAVMGGPFFLWLLLRDRKAGRMP